MSGTEPTTIPTPTALSSTTPTAFTAIARGATPGRSPHTDSRPNGADGSPVTHSRSEQPAIPCAPLGRGTWATRNTRVSPFAITAYPVGITNSIVSLIVEMIEPYQGRVYDPAMGSGGFFHSVRPKGAFDDSPGQRPGNHPTTWRLAAMNMAIRGIDFGKEPADTFTRDQHPDLRADFVLSSTPQCNCGWHRKNGDVNWQPHRVKWLPDYNQSLEICNV